MRRILDGERLFGSSTGGDSHWPQGGYGVCSHGAKNTVSRAEEKGKNVDFKAREREG